MKKIAFLLASAFLISASHAYEDDTSASERNAKAIVQAIERGADLTKTGLTQVLHDIDFDELANLKGCTASLDQNITLNLAIHSWKCDAGTTDSGSSSAPQRTTIMRFRDDGSLFALAINPLKMSFAPTQSALAARRMVPREQIARNFAQAVEAGSDATLAGLIPLTSYQQQQLSQLSGGRSTIIQQMTPREMREARKNLGQATQFYERPEDGIDLTIASDKDRKDITIFFDSKDRPIGIVMEPSLLTTSITTSVQ